MENVVERRLGRVEDVSRMLGQSKSKTHKDFRMGRLPRPIRIGRNLRWDLLELGEWVTAGCPSAEKWESQKGAPR